MTEVVVLNIESRERTGTGGARAARRDGFVPGIIYGDKKEPTPIRVSHNVLYKHLHAGGFFTKLFDLNMDGKTERVLAREVQLHPVKDFPEHVDFMRVTDKTRIWVDIPIHVLNEKDCPGLRAGGILNLVRHVVEVTCLANNIPAYLEVDLTGLEMGDSVHISAVKLPEGVKPTIDDRDFTILQIAAPKLVTETDETAEAAEGEEGAEGAEAAEGDEKDADAKKGDDKED